jgi:hypothetical protein
MFPEQTSPQRRALTLCQSLQLALGCIRPLAILLEEKTDSESSEEEVKAQKMKLEEASRMAFFLNSRLQTVLLDMLKLAKKIKM